MASSTGRDLDLVVLGATGFTGGLTATYLARHAPHDLRWAIAGRDPDRLARRRDELAGEGTGDTVPEVLVADVGDAGSLRSMAERTRALVTTVGPYLAHGAPVVAACAAAGTDYLDLTGEPEFVDRTWIDHHDEALRSGARLVHACGFDSVPHDLGAFHTVGLLPRDEPIRLRGVVRAGGMMSGGTFHSALGAMSRARQAKATARERRTTEQRPADRRSQARAGRPHRDPVLGYWLLPLPTIDPIVVARCGAALERYGPDFAYSHYVGTKTLRYAAGGAAAVGALGVAAHVPPLRRLLGDRMPQGQGPDEARRERSWFTVDLVGEAGGQTVHTRVSGGDPGYTETATMLAESALCLLGDDVPDLAGQVTTAQAMGDSLITRLRAAGIAFDVLS